MKWAFYLVHTLTALLVNYELIKDDDDKLTDGTETTFHDICVVEDRLRRISRRRVTVSALLLWMMRFNS